MKKIFYNMSVFLLLTFGILSYNVALSNNVTAAVVNVQVMLEKSSHIRAMESMLNDEFSSRNLALENKQKKIKIEGEAFNRDKDILSDRDRVAAERKIVRMQQDFQRMLQELDVDVKARQSEEFARLNKIINKIIRRVAVDKSIDLVFQSQIVLYSNGLLDITDDIMNELENDFKEKRGEQ